MTGPTSPTVAVVDDQVLDVVAGLVRELAGGAGPRPGLDDSLDRDLGISSLERVELLLRLEQVFGVRLADSVMAEAATPRDLVTAIRVAAPAAAATAPVARQAAVVPGTPSPTSVPAGARSLIEALRWHAGRAPDRIHIYLRNDDDTETAISYGELLAAATSAIAGTRRVFPDGAWLLRRRPITVTFGAPLVPSAEGWPEMVRLREAAVEVIRRGCGESALTGEPTEEVPP